MSYENRVKTSVVKICVDGECTEMWDKHPAECAKIAKDFVYCPYCSEELNLTCGACHESLTSKDYKYCPWCGAEFGDD